MICPVSRTKQSIMSSSTVRNEGALQRNARPRGGRRRRLHRWHDMIARLDTPRKRLDPEGFGHFEGSFVRDACLRDCQAGGSSRRYTNPKKKSTHAYLTLFGCSARGVSNAFAAVAGR